MEKLQTTANADLLTSRLASLIDAGRLGAARPLLAAVRRLEPSSLRLAMLSARLAMREETVRPRASRIGRGRGAVAGHAGLRKCRADLRMQMDDREGAAADAAEAVILDRSDPAAKALLGMLMLELKRPADAIACLAEAVAAEPANPAYCEGLAAAQEAAGDADAALATLIAGIAAAPARVAVAQRRRPGLGSPP